MKFKPFTLTLFDDGDAVEQAHIHPELTMITTVVNGRREPPVIIDTPHFLSVADAIKLAMADVK